MIVRCPDCRTDYDVNPVSRLEAGTRVRCPRCRAVFPLPIAVPAATSPEGAPLVTVPPQAGAPDAGSAAPSGTAARPPAGPAPDRPRPRSRILDPALARRLARAMVSEIVLNRREEREAARETGRLLAAFGPAIADAYRVYGERVGPQLRESRRIFRDAVNDILGGGRELL